MTTTTPALNLTDIISINWGPSPEEPINLITVEYDDDIIAWEGTLEDADDLAQQAGFAAEETTPDGVTKWAR